MLYSLRGKLLYKKEKFLVLENRNIGYKIFVSRNTLDNLPEIGKEVFLFLHHDIKEDAENLFGFLSQEEQEFFENLISVSGVGPKSALGILDLGRAKDLKAAISSGKPDLLIRASGIGKKVAEKIILELKPKFEKEADFIADLEKDLELEEALICLGYRKPEVKRAVSSLPKEEADFQKRFRAVLKILGKKK